METLYKITGPKLEAVHGGDYRYPRKGRWTKAVPNPLPCCKGYHLVKLSGLLDWVHEGGILWVAEGDGQPIWHDHKAVFSRVRLVKKVGVLSATNLRLWSADCAERVVHLTTPEGSNNPNPRPVAAIEAARKFAREEISAEELDAAGDAAWAAAGAAARAAARAAEQQWQNERLLAILKGETLGVIGRAGCTNATP